MVRDDTPGGGTSERMTATDVMPGDATDHRTPDAAFGENGSSGGGADERDGKRDFAEHTKPH